MLPSYVAASALFRMLAGLFLDAESRPQAVILRTPNGELEDDMHAVTAWLRMQPDEENRLLSKPITFTHFAQLWYPYANEVIATATTPFVSSTTEVKGRDISHPLRPAKPHSERSKVLYSRFLPALKKHVELHYLSPDSIDSLNAPSLLSASASIRGLGRDVVQRRKERLQENNRKAHSSPLAIQLVAEVLTSVALLELRWAKEDEMFEGSGVGNYDQSKCCMLYSWYFGSPRPIVIDLLEIEDDEDLIRM